MKSATTLLEIVRFASQKVVSSSTFSLSAYSLLNHEIILSDLAVLISYGKTGYIKSVCLLKTQIYTRIVSG